MKSYSPTGRNLLESEEAQFDSYALKVSKMKGWRLAGELADQLKTFDILKSEPGAESSVELKNTSRKIEIVTKENSKRKKY